MNIGKQLTIAVALLGILLGQTGLCIESTHDTIIVANKDSWWGNDKITHAMVSFTVAGITCGIAKNMLNNSKQGSIAIGLSIPLSAGLLKEWFDLKHPKTHRASIKDFLTGLYRSGSRDCRSNGIIILNEVLNVSNSHDRKSMA